MNVYDFDDTIYDGDSTRDFFKFCRKQKKSLIFLIPFQIINYCFYLGGFISKKKLKERYFGFLKHIDNIDEMVARFWTVHENKIKPFYKKLHSNDDLIISASPIFLLEPICNKLGVKLIATRVGKHSGKFESENCFGAEKVKMFNSTFSNQEITNFYSDSLTDSPMSLISKNAFIVKDNDVIEWSKHKESLIKKLKRIIFEPSFVKFLIVGVINVINGVLFSHLYSRWFDANLAFVFGYSTSLMISYVLNSLYTFRHGLSINKFVKFVMSYIPNFVIQNVAVFIIYNLLGYDSLIAYIISAIIGIPITYAFLYLFVYKNKQA